MAKILLVEDDNNLREVYEDRLLAEGYDIVSARDGEEALTVAMKERPDLIISDVMMPKISGFDMLDIIRSTEETKYVKVIMMTALSQAEDRDRAVKLGADRYLVKSQVTLEDVAKAARDVLAGIEAPGQTEAPKAPETTPAPTAPVIPEPTPEPVVATPEPESVSAVSPAPEPVATPIPDPVATPDPNPVPAPEPVAIPAPDPIADPEEPAAAPEPVETTVQEGNPALDAITQNSTTEEQSAVESSNPESMAEEQSAIAKQIESFIDSKKSVTQETPVDNDAVAQPTLVVDQQPPSATKRVIQPLSDEEDPKPDLESLLKKEQEKDQIAQIVQQVTTTNSDNADEAIAESVLKQASFNNQDVQPEEPNPNDLQIAGDGQLTGLNVTATESEEPVAQLDQPTVQPVTTEENNTQPAPTPVIPHTNGNSIDGVSAPQPGVSQPSQNVSKPAIDPNSIAL